MPRGFCGATGTLEEVELILVCAEPGDPHALETYDPRGTPLEHLRAAYAHVYTSLKQGTDLFHRNIRSILGDCFPGLDFDRQLRRTWITESVKCSAARECGPVAAGPARACRDLYLDRELALFPNALVVALGRKAARRLTGNQGILEVAAAAPPFGSTTKARATWRLIAGRLAEKRSGGIP